MTLKKPDRSGPDGLLPPPWQAMANRAGGNLRLAREFGVAYMTLWRWANAQALPGRHTRAFVDAWARRHGFVRPFRGQ